MPSQVTLGKAFEFACVAAIAERLDRADVPYSFEETATFQTAKNAFLSLSDDYKTKYQKAARTGIAIILPLEPRLLNSDGNDPLFLRISPDSVAQGEDGDVRDVVCIRSQNGWEVGMSCKHNHQDLKHPRLTKKQKQGEKLVIADFGQNWIGHSCSQEYFNEVSAVYNIIQQHIGESWSSAFGTNENKQNLIYKPILDAVTKEIRRLCNVYEDAPAKFLKYFLGSRDFYKVISLESSSETKVEGFNMYGTLNASAKGKRPRNHVYKLKMPSKLYDIRYKQKSNGEQSSTTIRLVFDEGWTIDMRLHSGDSKIKPTGLKFAVSLGGNPNGLYQQQIAWDEVI